MTEGDANKRNEEKELQREHGCELRKSTMFRGMANIGRVLVAMWDTAFLESSYSGAVNVNHVERREWIEGIYI